MMSLAFRVQEWNRNIAAASIILAVAIASGCETTQSPGAQPSRVIVMQANSADYRQIKDELESALKSREEGDREAFLAKMEKAMRSSVKFLGKSSKFKVSDETLYQFLSDRLKDAPAYGKSYSAAALSKLEASARRADRNWAAAAGGGLAAGDFDGSLSPEMVKSALEAMLSDWGEAAFAVDDALVRHVSYFIKYYVLCDTERTNRAFERSRRYMPFIRDAFGAHDLHEDVAFAVPFVESRFTTSPCSSAGALGMFQFMPNTAREYGMRVDAENVPGRDERLDWEKEASAAARYLVKSRNVFGSSVLALGAYHHGSMKVVQVLLKVAERSKTRSFSPIFNHGELEPFSREYIPQCLAAAYLYRYMNQERLERLPGAAVRYESIREPLPVDKLSRRYGDFMVHNQDLSHAERIYCYASTGGYVLITGSNAPPARSARAKTQEEKPPSREQACIPPQTALETTGENGEKSAERIEPDARPGKNGSSCNILYTFQKGNSLAELARMFGVDLHTLLSHPVNSRWKEQYPRSPRPGAIVVIPQLAPTTAVLSSPQSSGADYRFYTAQNQTLREIAQTVTDAFESSASDHDGAGCTGKGLTPERILYWNRDHLPQGATVEDPLPAGIPLFIVSDFR
ncbi:MAG: transglycosylase SLT domain-containing protein [Desulfobacteraceae bacterium]|nr:transglycosylase SLT domain-containing protein [Desulfobacteraceae bacterium]